MKRFWLLLVVGMLSACSVQLGPSVSVNVTPAPVTLGTGDSQVLTASLSSGEAQDFLWTLNSGGGILSPTRGKSVTYTAPEVVGDYDITVSAVGVEAKSAVATVNVLKKFIANSDPQVILNPDQGDKTLTSGVTKRYIVDVPTQLTQGLLYFELKTTSAVTLTVKDKDQKVIATSNDPKFFSSASPASNVLSSQAIVASVTCRGPCVIVKNTGQSRYILELSASSDATYDLFIFDDPYSDGLEPNDSVCSTTATNNNSLSFDGAIETLDDVDCFQSPANVSSVTLSIADSPSTVVPLRAELRRADNDEIIRTLELTPGGATTSVIETRAFGVAVKVLVRGVGKAGPVNNSKYKVIFTTN
jgi:hypothetical protein